MESVIQISKINDFIFCPYSVYLHSIYESFHSKTYHVVAQTRGKIVHAPIDKKTYSTSKHILQGTSVYCQKYGLVGKIDLFDIKKGKLIERKYQIKKIYDGYKYQLYAQYFSLLEKGYVINSLELRSLVDNKKYSVPLPQGEELLAFEKIISDMRSFYPGKEFTVNAQKCKNCIYKELCSYTPIC